MTTTQSKHTQLLKSAPDLLAALKELLLERYACDTIEQFDENGNWTCNSPASINARKALAKAEGTL